MSRIIPNAPGGGPNTLARSIVTTEAGNKVLVSTVKLFGGLGWEYETMVFLMDEAGTKVVDWLELDCLRCDTGTTAMKNHTQLVGVWYEDAQFRIPDDDVSTDLPQLTSGEES